MVTAAAQGVPHQLLDQLAIGGLLVIPIEKSGQQRLITVRRTEDGFEESDLGAVVFVPLLSGLA
jgi:protein-L-isoaspartate(D-aspartate) O-methyltransferase